MRARIFLLILAGIFLFVAGCTLKKNQSYGCCELDASGTCARMVGDLSDGVEAIPTNTIWCNPATGNGTCNITVRVTAQVPQAGGGFQTAEVLTRGVNDGNPIQPVVNICTDRVVACASGDCQAQVCGPFKYNPTPIPSLADSVTFKDEAERDGEVDALSAAGDDLPLNLYRATCFVLPMDEKLQNYFTNAKGSAVNVFRFGIGNSFSDFDAYRFMFPFRDAYCNVNPFVEGGKERFMNYLFSPDEFLYKQSVSGRRDIRFPLDNLEQPDYCPFTQVSPFVGADYFGNIIPGYKMSLVTYGAQLAGSAQTQVRAFTQDVDRKFYRNFLSILYKDEIDASYNAGFTGGVPFPAPFECENPTDCNSGVCSFNEYSRGLCKVANSNEWTRCSCNGPSRSCEGINTSESYLNNGPAPTTDAEITLHLNAYVSQGQEFIVKNKQNPFINIYQVNPSCDFTSSVVQGIELGSSYGQNCEVREDGTYVCDPNYPVNPVFGVRCTRGTGGQWSCGSNLAGGSGTYVLFRNCQYSAPRMTCTAESHFVASSCTSQGIPPGATLEQVSCTNGVSCSLYPPFSSRDPNQRSNVRSGNTIVLSTDPLFVDAAALCSPYSGCTYYRDSAAGTNTLDCPRQSAQVTYDDCTTDATGAVVCNRQTELAQQGTLAPPLDRNRFPTDVRFFGGARAYNGATVIGYSLIPASEFVETDFYKNCQLTPANYETVTVGPAPTAAPSDIVGALQSGFLFPPPDPIDEKFFGQQVAKAPVCGFFGDELGYYYYVSQYVLVKPNANNQNQVGRCELNPATFAPVTKTFGWCEACSYATLAKQVIQTNSAYTPTVKTTNLRIDNAGATQSTNLCTPSMQSAAGSSVRTPALFCPSADDPNYESTRPSSDLYPTSSYFDSLPEGVFLQERQRQYLQEGIMPVFDATHQSNWGTTTASSLIGTLQNQPIAGGNLLTIDLAFGSSRLTRTLAFTGSAGAATVPETARSPDGIIRVSATREAGTFAINANIELWANGRVVNTIPARVPEGNTQSVQSAGATSTVAYFQDAIINRGPSIVIVDSISLSDAQNPSRVSTVQARLQKAKEICPSCLVSFKINNGAPGSRLGSERIDDDIATLAALNRVAPGIFVAVDPLRQNTQGVPVEVVSFDLYPHEFSSEQPTLCAAPNSLSERIVSQVERRSRELLVSYNDKLSLISDFSLDVSDANCWLSNNGPTRFFSYFFAKQKRLARTGLIGAIYSDAGSFPISGNIISTPAGIVPNLLSIRYCALEKGARNLASDEPITVYSKVYASEPSDATCVECTDADIALGRCTTIPSFPAQPSSLPLCSNGQRCNLPNPLPPVSTIRPTAQGPPNQWKCPDLLVPKPCTPCSAKQGDLSCMFYYPDGSNQRATYQFSSLSDLTPDIIASIPDGEVCCLLDSAQNSYTYVKHTTVGRVSAPIQFPSSGDPRSDCGLGDYSELDPQACGVTEAPLRNYRLECIASTTSVIPPPNCVLCTQQEINSGTCSRTCSDGRDCTVLPQDQGFISILGCPSGA